MRRFHVHLSVSDLKTSLNFYTNLFGQSPSVEKSDYAKWMLENPKVNFAISSRGHREGANHFGFQAETEEELFEMKILAENAAGKSIVQSKTTCCYAKSEKHWTMDPGGLAWEHFFTMGETQVFGIESKSESDVCCNSNC